VIVTALELMPAVVVMMLVVRPFMVRRVVRTVLGLRHRNGRHRERRNGAEQCGCLPVSLGH
jgi:hypothetical protein